MKRNILYLAIALLLIMVLSVVQSYKGSVAQVGNWQQKTVSLPSEVRIATWLWKSPDEMSSTEMESLLSFAQTEGVDVVYLNIAKYIDLYELPKGKDRDEGLAKLDQDLSQFVRIANLKGISVEALSGGINWANDGYSYIPLEILEYVKRFNATHPDTALSGVHFDIEFYNQDEFIENQVEYTQEFLFLMEGIGKDLALYNKTAEKQLALGLDTAFWLDETRSDIKKVYFRGSSQYPIYHIINLMSNFPHTSVTLMAYRNNSERTLSVVENEFEHERLHNLRVPIYVGQETDVTEERNISYSNASKVEFKTELLEINESLKVHDSFGGVAIHNLESFQRLKD